MVTWIDALRQVTASGEVIHAAYSQRMADYYVECSVTGEQITLSELKYWSVERQECYKDAEAGLKRYTEIHSET